MLRGEGNGAFTYWLLRLLAEASLVVPAHTYGAPKVLEKASDRDRDIGKSTLWVRHTQPLH